MRRLVTAALLLVAASGVPAAAAAPPGRKAPAERNAPAPALDEARAAALATALEGALVARLRLLPAADGALAEAASCAYDIIPVRPRLFREARPMILGLPGGLVLVSTGLLAATESDAELRSAIAHEAAHVARGDLLDRLTKAYGAARLASIADGGSPDVLAGIAANMATGGLLVRHGSPSEQAAEDEATRAGCPGGLARILARAGTQRRHRKQDRRAHPIAAGPEAAGAADPAIDLLQRVREAAGRLP
jgi:beta-barrel assembly-enhancing protease